MTSPDLKTWAQNHISALYTPESDDDLQSTFEATFSPSAQIFMGSDLMDREAMKDDLMKRRAAAVSATLDWDSIVVEAKDPQSPEDAGTFNGLFTVQRSMRYRIRAAPAQLHTAITVKAQIERDSALAADGGDSRRIVKLNVTYEDSRPPLHLQQPRVVQQGNGADDIA